MQEDDIKRLLASFPNIQDPVTLLTKFDEILNALMPFNHGNVEITVRFSGGHQQWGDVEVTGLSFREQMREIRNK